MKLKIPYENQLADKLSLSYSLARTAHFAVQQLSLPLFELLATGKTRKKASLDPAHIKSLYTDLYRLLKKDTENISQGLYPLEVLKPEAAMKHWMRFPKILWDGYSISKRRDQQSFHEFSEKAQELGRDLPDYYQRNFHYQSDGYLSEKSADLYEHQVEILFAGAADAMRRSLIPLLKEKYPDDGEGLHFLEVAAGTGRLTRFMKLAFPKAKITVLDLSYPYLKKARENLESFSRLDFVQGKAEELPFQDNMFDVVYSCFLFHELPLSVRRQAVKEGARVLKADGHLGFVDSVQKEDARDLMWALEQFPTNFHEPFFKNYLMNPMEGLLQYAGFDEIQTHRAFLSKAVLAKKTTA